MKENLQYNLNSYLYKDSKKYTFLWFIPILLFLFSIWYMTKKKVYIVEDVRAQVTCSDFCTLKFFHEATENLSYDFIKINKVKYEVDEVLFGNAMLDSSNNAIQELILKAKEYKGNNNEFVQLQIYKNKETMLQKIYKIIKER